MKKVTSVEKTQIVKTQRDLTDANARLVSMEMDTTARVSQCLFGSLVVVNHPLRNGTYTKKISVHPVKYPSSTSEPRNGPVSNRLQGTIIIIIN